MSWDAGHSVQLRRAVEQANIVLCRLQMPHDRPVPVVERVLPALGVRLYWANLVTEDGFTVRQDSRYTVCLSRTLHRDPARLRFTAAHEAGHVVLGHLAQDSVCGLTLHDSRKEREANVFASALLMPENAFHGQVPPWDKRALSRLLRQFGVSWEALIIRLDELGLQSRDASRALFAEPDAPTLSAD